jgi:hypothetical protein
MKGRTAVRIIRSPDFPFVCVNDGAADGKSKSHSLLFRGEETVEYLFAFSLRNAAATICNGYPHSAVLRFGSNEQLAFGRIVMVHRFAAIHYQVKYDLLKLDLVAGDWWQILGKVSIHGDVVIDEIVAH